MKTTNLILLTIIAEDEALANSKHFWKLIDEGRNARRL